MSAIGLLCEIAAQNTKVCAAQHRGDPAFTALVQCGLLTEAGVVSSMVCVECDQPHDAEVVHDGGTYGYRCPDIGFVPLDRADAQAVAPDLSKLVVLLASFYDCKRRRSDPLVGQTWRIGAVASEGGDIVLYFQPRLSDEADLRRLQDALAREVAAPFRLVLTAEGRAPVPGAHVVPLFEVVEIEAATGELRPLSDLRVVVGAPVKNTGGAPNRYRAKIMDLIQRRASNREALNGINAEARAIADAFQRAHPAEQAPSLATIKRYLSEAPDGS